MFKQEDGFTLIEMLIVLMIITVLILLIVPNLSDKTSTVYEEGCEALKQTVQTQVNAYALDKGELPKTLDDLVGEYISKDQKQCKNSDSEFKLVNGKVEIQK